MIIKFFRNASPVLLGIGMLVFIGYYCQQSFNPKHFSFPNSEVHYLHSKSVGVEYKLYISLPKEYKTTQEKYPVIYLLDADYSFPLAHAITEHLSDRKNLPKVILVGIAYGGELQYKKNRTRDYTPIFVADGGPGPEYQQYSGGGPKFKDFLTQELMPYIQRKYRVADNSTLVGHSYGGLFASWIVLTQPDLFNNYIIVSPSLWYGKKNLLGIKIAPNNCTEKNNVYFAIGSLENCHGDRMVDDVKVFHQTLKQHFVHTALEIFSGENHDSVFPVALSKGLIYTQNKDKPEFLKRFEACE